VYAAHPSTSVLCLTYKVGKGPKVLITAKDLFDWSLSDPEEWYDKYARIMELIDLAEDPEVVFVAHNAFFEQNIWKEILVKRYDFPEIMIPRWRCTAAKAAFYALPRKLEKVGEVLNLNVRKDMDGHRVMQKLARPRKPSKLNPSRWWEPEVVPQDFQKLYDYNLTDVDVECEVDTLLPELRPLEQEIWFMDQRLNHRGIRLDIPAVKRAIEYLEICQDRLLREFKRVTDGYVEKPTQRNRFIEWIEAHNVVMSDLQAATVDRMLARHKNEPFLPEKVYRALQIRRQLGRTSTAKYVAMTLRVSADGRLRDTMLYYGAARTGRWSGKGVQPQNFVRPKVDVYKAVDALMKYDYDTFSMLYSVTDTIAEIIRGMIIAEEGHQLFVADFSAIEARVLAWLADDTELLDQFHNNECPYCALASTIYDKVVTKQDTEERQIGKVGILALGYQGGIAAYAQMANTYRLDMEPVYPLIWKTTTPEEREKALKAYNAYKHQADEPVSMEYGLAADIVKQRYREKRKKIVQYWYDLEDAAIEAVQTGKPIRCGKVVFFLNGGGEMRFLHIKLPSGRCLAYHRPKLKDVKTPWGQTKKQLTYMGVNDKNQYIRIDTYGGKLAENITQAVSRDLMAEGFLRIEKAGYTPLLSVHDEAISEAPLGFGSIEEYETLMAELPAWAEGLPVKAEGWAGPRYKKG
jgi:DNA polymerase